MITEFKISVNPLRGCKVVEVWFDGKFLAVISPSDPDVCGFRVVTKHGLAESSSPVGMVGENLVVRETIIIPIVSLEKKIGD